MGLRFYGCLFPLFDAYVFSLNPKLLDVRYVQKHVPGKASFFNVFQNIVLISFCLLDFNKTFGILQYNSNKR